MQSPRHPGDLITEPEAIALLDGRDVECARVVDLLDLGVCDVGSGHERPVRAGHLRSPATAQRSDLLGHSEAQGAIAHERTAAIEPLAIGGGGMDAEVAFAAERLGIKTRHAYNQIDLTVPSSLLARADEVIE